LLHPPFCRRMRRIYGGPRPVNRSGMLEPLEQALVNASPYACLLPVAQALGCGSRTEAHRRGFRTRAASIETTLCNVVTSARYVEASSAHALSKRSALWDQPRSVRMA
jgi:hypothetical protein